MCWIDRNTDGPCRYAFMHQQFLGRKKHEKIQIFVAACLFRGLKPGIIRESCCIYNITYCFVVLSFYSSHQQPFFPCLSRRGLCWLQATMSDAGTEAHSKASRVQVS